MTILWLALTVPCLLVAWFLGPHSSTFTNWVCIACQTSALAVAAGTGAWWWFLSDSLLVVLWWRALRISQARDAQLARDLHETIRTYRA